ncbi:MAG: hypothetical protein ABIK43_01340 [candidate division WOR-3 bacterium]
MLDTRIGRILGTALGAGLILIAVIMFRSPRTETTRTTETASLNDRQTGTIYRQRVSQTQKLLRTDGTYIDIDVR